MWNYQPTPHSGYLIHYGVKGRSGKKGAGLYYRNGELTEEGRRHYYGDGKGNGIRGALADMRANRQAKRERYKKGEALEKERRDISQKEHENLRKSSKEYKDLDEQVKDLKGRAENQLDEENSRLFRDRLWNKEQDKAHVDSQLSAKAREKSFKKMEEKYGKKSLDDIEYYNKKHENRQAAALLGSVAGVTLLTIMAVKHA